MSWEVGETVTLLPNLGEVALYVVEQIHFESYLSQKRLPSNYSVSRPCWCLWEATFITLFAALQLSILLCNCGLTFHRNNRSEVLSSHWTAADSYISPAPVPSLAAKEKRSRFNLTFHLSHRDTKVKVDWMFSPPRWEWREGRWAGGTFAARLFITKPPFSAFLPLRRPAYCKIWKWYIISRSDMILMEPTKPKWRVNKCFYN